MEASPVVCPEQIALQRAPNARHDLSVSKLYGGVQEIARIAKDCQKSPKFVLVAGQVEPGCS
jgi:hypothetical protein